MLTKQKIPLKPDTTKNYMKHSLEEERDIARDKAIDALSRYKFQMFGYWAAIWVHMNRLCPEKQASPFAGLVKSAKLMCPPR